MEKRAARRSTPEARLRRSGNIVDLNGRTSLKDRAANAVGTARNAAKAAYYTKTSSGRRQIENQTKKANARTSNRQYKERMSELQRQYSEAAENANRTIRSINNKEKYGSTTVRQAKQKGKKSKRR
jgi:hypothetical protein